MKLEYMGVRQGRTYPILGLVLAHLFTKAVIAKYAASNPNNVYYKPWHSYNKPNYLYPPKPVYYDYGSHHHHHHYPSSSYWRPAQSYLPYGPPIHHTTPAVSLTTNFPITTVSPPPQQVVNINGLNNNDEYYTEVIAESINNDQTQSESEKINVLEEPIASGSKQIRRRQVSKTANSKAKNNYKRGAQNRIVSVKYKRNRNSQKRRRTTTENYYDDSYEDYTTTRSKRRKNKPSNRRRTTTPAYEYDEDVESDEVEDEDYDESYEQTTRPYRRRRPTMRNKNKRRPPAYDDDYGDYYNNFDFNSNRNGNNGNNGNREANTETVHFRPRQGTTTTTTEASTTNQMTTTTVQTTTNNSTSNNTFTGYGPSNGNENISITYGPPTRQHYTAPYFDWYNHQARNAIVKRVHDIVGFDNDIFHRRLT